jgi:molecular chaperone GrpE
VSNTSKSFIISQELCNSLSQELGTLKRENTLLKQSLREQQTQAVATCEDLFLELLEVGDALENLLKLLENPNLSPEFIARLPRNVGAVYRKFLNVLAKRQVSQIETEGIEGTQPDFTLCRVVEQEVVADIPEQSITKIVRQGFRYGEKVLRPVEVITSKKK